jgi:thiol-disulfide isomerase/thioredoxin
VAKSSRAEAAAKAAQMRAEAARKDRQRKQVIAAVVAVVVIIAAVVIGAVVANRPPPAAGGPGSTSASADAALAKLVALPQATLDASAAPNPNQAPAKLEGGTDLTQDGKPKVLYVGAEYCPFCAMERWPLIGALSKFGTFSGLKPTTSSSDDVHPDTPTWTFAGSTYTSDVLTFEAVETADREQKPLEPLEGENAAIFQKFNPSGGIPWITYGGTHATNGATVDANVLDGKTYDQIIAGIEDPSSDIGKSVNPAMTMITAQLCELTGGKPTNVCTSQAVRSASVLLKR